MSSGTSGETLRRWISCCQLKEGFTAVDARVAVPVYTVSAEGKKRGVEGKEREGDWREVIGGNTGFKGGRRY